MFLSGRGVAYRSALVTVSDVPVTVARLVSKLVTHAAWAAGSAPPRRLDTPFTFVSAIKLSHVMRAEGNSGTIHAVVEWSDGTAQPLRSHNPGVNELNVSSLAPANL